MSFWIIAALIACAATAAIVWPLLGARIAQDPESTDSGRRLDVYRDRRLEIEREREAGRLTEAEARAAEAELLDEVASSFDETIVPAARPVPARRRLGAAIVVAIALPLLAMLTYQRVGAPHATDVAALAPSPGDTLAQVRAVIAELEARVAANPDDGEAWAMLAAANKLIGENELAIPAFERALERLGPHARLLADLAESIAITQGGRFAGRPVELLEQALAADPRDPKANGLMGAAMFQAGDMALARKHLEALLAQLDPDGEQAAQIREVLANLGAAPGQPGVAGEAPGPGAAPDARPLVAGQVQIDAGRRALLPDDATVFVSARAPTGPRMPFAATRAPLSDFDGRFALGDAQSMLAQRLLSDAPEVVVEVRISAKGDATPGSGDLFGVSEPVAPGAAGATDLVVRIDQVVP